MAQDTLNTLRKLEIIATITFAYAAAYPKQPLLKLSKTFDYCCLRPASCLPPNGRCLSRDMWVAAEALLEEKEKTERLLGKSFASIHSARQAQAEYDRERMMAFAESQSRTRVLTSQTRKRSDEILKAKPSLDDRYRSRDRGRDDDFGL